MVMQHIGATVETAAKVVKLSAGDWKKMAYVLAGLLAVLSGLVWTLSANAARAEVKQLHDADAAQILRATEIDARVKVLETLSRDVNVNVALLKNDVGWIRAQMENNQKQAAIDKALRAEADKKPE